MADTERRFKRTETDHGETLDALWHVTLLEVLVKQTREKTILCVCTPHSRTNRILFDLNQRIFSCKLEQS